MKKTMLERLAKRLWSRRNDGPWELGSPQSRSECYGDATAVLYELRRPDDQMRAAGAAEVEGGGTSDDVFVRMINVAIKEGGK